MVVTETLTLETRKGNKKFRRKFEKISLLVCLLFANKFGEEEVVKSFSSFPLLTRQSRKSLVVRESLSLSFLAF